MEKPHVGHPARAMIIVAGGLRWRKGENQTMELFYETNNKTD